MKALQIIIGIILLLPGICSAVTIAGVIFSALDMRSGMSKRMLFEAMGIIPIWLIGLAMGWAGFKLVAGKGIKR